MANEGARDFRIQLILDSNPSPLEGDFSWFFNNQPLTDEQDGILLGADFIQIGNVSRRNAGTYRVLSSNTAGSSEFSFQLVVNCELIHTLSFSKDTIYLYIIDRPRYAGRNEYEAAEGTRDYRIELMLDSNPIPGDGNFFWFFNGRRLLNGQDGAILGVNFIQFRSLSRSNAGSYRVMSSSTAGSGDYSFQLTVTCKDIFSNETILVTHEIFLCSRRWNSILQWRQNIQSYRGI